MTPPTLTTTTTTITVDVDLLPRNTDNDVAEIVNLQHDFWVAAHRAATCVGVDGRPCDLAGYELDDDLADDLAREFVNLQFDSMIALGFSVLAESAGDPMLTGEIVAALSTVNPIDRFCDALTRVGRPVNRGMASCPAHEDSSASLSVTEGDDGRVLFNCFAGCPPEQVVAALGLHMGDLFADRKDRDVDEFGTPIVHRRKPRPVPVAAITPKPSAPDRTKIVGFDVHYPYFDADGTYLYSVLRWNPCDADSDGRFPADPKKQFRQRIFNTHPDTGQPITGSVNKYTLKGVRRVPYRLPETVAAVAASHEIWFVEGEKDVHTLLEHGHTATTSSQGADGFQQMVEDGGLKHLAGGNVVVWPDNDNPGRLYAANIIVACHTHGINVTAVVAAPNLPNVKDATDYLTAGHNIDDLSYDAITDDPSAPDPQDWAATIIAQHQLETAAAKAATTGTGPTAEASDADVIDLDDHRHRTVGGTVRERLSDAVDDLYTVYVNQRNDTMCVPLNDSSAALPTERNAQLRQELAAHVHTEHGDMPTDADIGTVLNVKAGLARADGRYRHLSAQQRVLLDTAGEVTDLAGHAQRVVVDLFDGQVAEVSKTGVRVVPAPVSFEGKRRRNRLTYSPVPADERDRVIDELCRLTAMSGSDGFNAQIVIAYIAAVVVGIETPALYLTGPAGAAKTTTARSILRVLDPTLEVTGKVKDVETFIERATPAIVLCLDNIGKINADLSDAICRATTGSNESVRKKYTDGEVYDRQIQCGIILTGIDVGILPTDLLSRTIIVNVDRIEADQRLGRAEVEVAGSAVRPAAFSLALDAAAAWYADTAVPANRDRLADWETLLHRIDRAFGWTLLDQHRASAKNAVRRQIDDLPFESLLLEFLATAPVLEVADSPCHQWAQGGAAELLSALNRYVEDRQGDLAAATLTSPWWPASTVAIGRRLSQFEAVAHKVGLTISRDRAKKLTLTLISSSVPGVEF